MKDCTRLKWKSMYSLKGEVLYLFLASALVGTSQEHDNGGW